MKSCYDLEKDFDLKCGHCDICHEEIDDGIIDPQPVIINGVKYETPCCNVLCALEFNKIEYDYK